ncbi:MAG: hypothetical protein Q4Q23_04225 [Methanobacteriaceae archaeon]|nr:hypothetical protein [Methanobacteriaceae archaeon]
MTTKNMEHLKEVYDQLYGPTFNMKLTKGTSSTGFRTTTVHNTQKLVEFYEKNGKTNNIYISFYNYNNQSIDHDKLVSNDKFYGEYAIFDRILIRVKNKLDFIIDELDEVLNFIHIRQLIHEKFIENLIKDTLTVQKTIEEIFHIKPVIFYTGLNECLIFILFDEIKLDNPYLTLNYIYKLIENNSKVTTINYENMDPLTQNIRLPHSKNITSRLYAHELKENEDYTETINKMKSPNITDYTIPKQDSTRIIEIIKYIDQNADKKLRIARINKFIDSLNEKNNEKNE